MIIGYVKKIINKLIDKDDKENIYTVYVSEIIVPHEFRLTRPRKAKMDRKRYYYKVNGEFESRIILNKDFVLKDGYTTYLLAKEFGIKKIDIMFEEE